MALREKLSIREISLRTGLSRNTITKHLNAGTIEAQFTTPERQSKLDPFADKLAGRPEIPHGSLPDSNADVWTQEQAASMPLPCAFDGFVEHSKRVSPTCLINFERNRYSVPASFANRPVSLRVSPDRLVVAAEGQTLCEHRRVIERSHKHPPRIIYDWRHYLAVLQRKPGALRNGAPFAELPPAFRQLQDLMLRRPGGDREMVDILALVLHHDEQAVLAAVEMALSAGVATKTHVLTLLHRLVDGKTIGGPDIDTPLALVLRRDSPRRSSWSATIFFSRPFSSSSCFCRVVIGLGPCLMMNAFCASVNLLAFIRFCSSPSQENVAKNSSFKRSIFWGSDQQPVFKFNLKQQ